MFASALAYSLIPTAIGLLLALGVIKWIIKSTLLKQLKIISFVIALFWNSIILTYFIFYWENNPVILPIVIGFIVTLLTHKIFRTKTTK